MFPIIFHIPSNTFLMELGQFIIY